MFSQRPAPPVPAGIGEDQAPWPETLLHGRQPQKLGEEPLGIPEIPGSSMSQGVDAIEASGAVQ